MNNNCPGVTEKDKLIIRRNLILFDEDEEFKRLTDIRSSYIPLSRAMHSSSPNFKEAKVASRGCKTYRQSEDINGDNSHEISALNNYFFDGGNPHPTTNNTIKLATNWDDTDKYINFSGCEELTPVTDYNNCIKDQNPLLLADSPLNMSVSTDLIDNDLGSAYSELDFHSNYDFEDYSISYDNNYRGDYFNDSTEDVSPNFSKSTNYTSKLPIEIIHTQPHKLINPKILSTTFDIELSSFINEESYLLSSKYSEASSFSSIFSYDIDNIQNIASITNSSGELTKEANFCNEQNERDSVVTIKLETKNNKKTTKYSIKKETHFPIPDQNKFKDNIEYYYYFDPDEGNPIILPEYPPLRTYEVSTGLKKKKRINKEPKPVIKTKKSQANSYVHRTSKNRIRKSKDSKSNKEFFTSLLSKLDRYCVNAYGRRSRNQEYYDKVRFQEILYKFSKTYF